MATKSLQRSKKELEKRGFVVGIVERFIPKINIRKDLFGLFDLIAFHPDKADIVGVQCCSDNSGDLMAHIRKIEINPLTIQWISFSRKFLVMAWGKRGSKNKRKLWTLREMVFDMEAGAFVKTD